MKQKVFRQRNPVMIASVLVFKTQPLTEICTSIRSITMIMIMIMIMAYPVGRQDWPISPARDFLHWSCKNMFSPWSYNKFVIDLACSVKMAVYSLANIELF